MPYDDCDFSQILEVLAAKQFIIKYEVSGDWYGCIPSWHRHQQINNKEMASEIPALTSANASLAENPPQSCQTMPRDARVLNASVTPDRVPSTELENSQGEYGIGKGNREREKEGEQEREGEEERTPVPTARTLANKAAIDIVFTHWKRVMQHPQANLDEKRSGFIRKALKSGYTVEQLQEAINGCALTPHNQGNNEKGQRYDGLHIIFRDADQIDRFIYNFHHPPRLASATEKHQQANIQTLQQWIDEKQVVEVEDVSK